MEDYATLSTKVEKMKSRDVDEIWHIIRGQLHNDALKIMQQISVGLPKGVLKQHDTSKG